MVLPAVRGSQFRFRLFRGRDVGCFAATRHGGAGRVDAPLALNVVLCFFEQLAHLRIAAREHGVAGFTVGVFLQTDRRCARVELERILAFCAKRGVVAHERPVAGLHRELLLFESVHQVVAVGDAVAVGDDDRRTFVRLSFLEGLDGVAVVAAHRNAEPRRRNRS